MGNYNRWIGMGNLTRDPELREVGEGRVAKFGLAVSRDYPVKETLFIDVEAWNRQADTIVRYFHKGDPILIEGRLRLDQWEKEGQKHSKVLVVLEGFEFVGGRRDRAGSQGDDREGPEGRAPNRSGRGGRYEDQRDRSGSRTRRDARSGEQSPSRDDGGGSGEGQAAANDPGQ